VANPGRTKQLAKILCIVVLCAGVLFYSPYFGESFVIQEASPLVFEPVTGMAPVAVVFAPGNGIQTSYELGMSLGAEESILQYLPR
jgi:hypothetical protein